MITEYKVWPPPPEQHCRHDSSVRVVGEEGVRRICCGKVVVVGVGGLGFPVLSYLAASGVGSGEEGWLTYIDDDVVEETNLGRQLFFTDQDVGRKKIEVVTHRLQGHYPALQLRPIAGHFPHIDAVDDLVNEADVLIDCTDSFQSKHVIAEWACHMGTPLVWGSVMGSYYAVACCRPSAPHDSRGPEQSFEVNAEEGHILPELFPRQEQAPWLPSAREVGVLPSVVGQAGTLMATQALMILGGFGSPLYRKILLADPVAGSIKTVEW